MLKKEIREELIKIGKDKALERLRTKNSFINLEFNRICNRLCKDSINSIDDNALNTYLKDLMYYDSTYFKDLLLNLGRQYKLACLHHLMLLYNTLDTEINKRESMMKMLINEYTERAKKIISRPVLDIYYKIQSDETLDDVDLNKFLKLVNKIIPEILETLYMNIEALIKRQNSGYHPGEAFYSYYIPNITFMTMSILELEFEYIVGQDEPHTKNEHEMLYITELIVWALSNPYDDPLELYFNKDIKEVNYVNESF